MLLASPLQSPSRRRRPCCSRTRGEEKARAPLPQLSFCGCRSRNNMPAAEAKLKKSRCANRFDCPGCLPTLHPGRGHRLTASRRAKATVKKALRGTRILSPGV
ncbi:Dynactin subunit 4 [Plecturocebus cupreus]